MGPVRPLIGATVLVLFWTNFTRGMLTNSLNRCDAPPCRCDAFARLTCNCNNEPEELRLTTEGERRLSPNTVRIEISNCQSVILVSSSLRGMGGLQAISFENISNLTLYPSSFELSTEQTPADIYITNTSIDLLPSFTFKGDAKDVHLRNVRIGQINAYAFANLIGTNELTMENCYVDVMEAHAFKKFDVGYLHVIGGSFGDVVPSRTMNDIEVMNKFMLDGVTMGTVRTSAFIIKRPITVVIQNCVFDTVEGQAFSVTTRGAVIIKNNTFKNLNMGAFFDIKSDPESSSSSLSSSKTNKPNDIIFKNNSLNNFEEGSVMFDRTSFRPELDNILINEFCDCQMMPIWRNNILNYSNVYVRYYSKNLPEENVNVGPDTFLCLDSNIDGNVPVNFNDYETRYCTVTNSTLLFIFILVGLLLVLLIGGFLIIWCCRRQRENNQKRWISVPTNAPDVVVSKKNGIINRDPGGPVDSRITMVVPDGRVYRETEFHVIVEKAEPLTTEL